MLPCSLSKKTSAILHFTHQHQHECISILNFTILLPPPAQARSSRMLPERALISDDLCVVVKHKKWDDFIHCCITHFKQACVNHAKKQGACPQCLTFFFCFLLATRSQLVVDERSAGPSMSINSHHSDNAVLVILKHC